MGLLRGHHPSPLPAGAGHVPVPSGPRPPDPGVLGPAPLPSPAPPRGRSRARRVASVAGTVALILAVAGVRYAFEQAAGTVLDLAGVGERPLPSFMAAGFPHEDPAFEDRMPDSVEGRSLKVWTVRGEHAAEVADDGLVAALAADLGVTVDAASLAVSGRWQESDPASWTFGFRFDGAAGTAVAAAYETRLAATGVRLEAATVGGRQVRAGEEDGSTLYLYGTAQAAYVVLAPTPAAAGELLAGIEVPPVVHRDADGLVEIALPPDWAVLTADSGRGQVDALAARHPELATTLGQATAWLDEGAILVGIRSTTEDVPQALQVGLTPDCLGADGDVDVVLYGGWIRDLYTLDTIPAAHRVAVGSGSAWEFRWTGTDVASTGPANDHGLVLVPTGPDCAMLWFVLGEGRMGVYEEALAPIVASFRVLP